MKSFDIQLCVESGEDSGVIVNSSERSFARFDAIRNALSEKEIDDWSERKPLISASAPRMRATPGRPGLSGAWLAVLAVVGKATHSAV